MKNNLIRKGNAPVTKYSRSFRILLFVLPAPVILYYIWTRGIVYFTFSREIYTDYFWNRAPWLLAHVICGVVATLIGPFQFITVVRTKNPALHRNLGKLYLACIVVSTFLSFYLVSTAQLGIVYAAGLAMLGVVWLGSSTVAYIAIRKRNIDMHREWMIKSYVLTLSFVCFRFVEDLLSRAGIGSFTERKVLMAWACWAIPFFVTVVVLQIRKLYPKNLHLGKPE